MKKLKISILILALIILGLIIIVYTCQNSTRPFYKLNFQVNYQYVNRDNSFHVVPRTCYKEHFIQSQIFTQDSRCSFVDSVYFDLISELHCSIYENRIFDSHGCESIKCKNDLIFNSNYYKNLIDRIENIRSFNSYFKRSFKIRRFIKDSFHLKLLSKLISKSQFYCDLDSGYKVYTTADTSWAYVERKYLRNINIENFKSLEIDEEMCYNEIIKILNKTIKSNPNSIFYCIIRDTDTIPGIKRYRDVFFEVCQKIDTEGYLSFEKKLLNPQSIIITYGYE